MIIPIIQHDIRRVLRNAKTWYCLATLQVLLAIIFNWLLTNFLKSQAISQAVHYGITEEVIHPFYAWFALLVLLFMPMLCTQMLCAEKQHGTIINYYCAPASASNVILAKFFTLIISLSTMLIFFSIMPLSIIISGALDWGQYFASVAGVFLLLCSATAICLSISAFMGNVMRANLLMFLVITGFVLLEWAALYAGDYAMFLQGFGLLKPLKGFLAGIISLRSTAYYLLIVLSFLCLGGWGYTRKWQQ